jgi:hypothetical protein
MKMKLKEKEKQKKKKFKNLHILEQACWHEAESAAPKPFGHAGFAGPWAGSVWLTNWTNEKALDC